MTTREALEQVKDALIQLPISIVGNNAIASTPQIKALAELVERDTPKFIKVEKTVWFPILSCPNCKTTFKSESFGHNFCYNCGQSIDWSDAE